MARKKTHGLHGNLKHHREVMGVQTSDLLFWAKSAKKLAKKSCEAGMEELLSAYSTAGTLSAHQLEVMFGAKDTLEDWKSMDAIDEAKAKLEEAKAAVFKACKIGAKKTRRK